MTIDDSAFYKDSAMRDMLEAIEYLNKLESESWYSLEAVDALKEAINWMSMRPVEDKHPKLFTGDMPPLADLTMEDMPTDPFRYPHIRELMLGIKHNGDRYV
jgi:hypothetical protein